MPTKNYTRPPDTSQAMMSYLRSFARIPVLWFSPSSCRLSLIGSRAEMRLSKSATFAPVWVRVDRIYANPALSERLVACDIDDSHEAFEASDHLPFLAKSVWG